MRLKDLRFSPKPISSIITVLLIPIFVQLGFWQWNRMHEKENLLHELISRLEQPPFTYAELISQIQSGIPLSLFTFRSLTVEGYFLENIHFLLDNQIHNGMAGYRVFTPFKVQDNSKVSNQDIANVILIDRGWIPVGANRNQLPTLHDLQANIPLENSKAEMPALQIKDQRLNLQGLINQPKQAALSRLETVNIIEKQRWPKVIQQINYTTLSKLLKSNVLPFILELPKESNVNFAVVSWEPTHLKKQVNRHLGYAVQWFTIALGVLIYYMVINIHFCKRTAK